jgi:hypothetical protein
LSANGSAWIVLRGSYSHDEEGNILLTPDCATIEELCHHIDGLKHDLERIQKQGRNAFETARLRPKKSPLTLARKERLGQLTSAVATAKRPQTSD